MIIPTVDYRRHGVKLLVLTFMVCEKEYILFSWPMGLGSHRTKTLAFSQKLFVWTF